MIDNEAIVLVVGLIVMGYVVGRAVAKPTIHLSGEYEERYYKKLLDELNYQEQKAYKDKLAKEREAIEKEKMKKRQDLEDKLLEALNETK